LEPELSELTLSQLELAERQLSELVLSEPEWWALGSGEGED
jgi:hypothetical protein